MSHRITKNIARPPPVSIFVNGRAVTAYEGESLATALIAADVFAMTRDAAGKPRGPFCNMGVCFDCIVTVEESVDSDTPVIRRVRACLSTVRPGLRISIPD